MRRRKRSGENRGIVDRAQVELKSVVFYAPNDRRTRAAKYRGDRIGGDRRMGDSNRDRRQLLRWQRTRADLRSRFYDLDLKFGAELIRKNIAGPRRNLTNLTRRPREKPQGRQFRCEIGATKIEPQRRGKSGQRELVASQRALERVGFQAI